MAKKKKKKVRLKIDEFNNYLSKIYLNGCMIDVVLDFLFDKGIVEATVKCEDDDLFLSCRGSDLYEGNLSESFLSIGDLGIFYKLMTTFSGKENVIFEMDKNKIVIKSKGHGQFNYLLSEKDTIVTVSEGWDRKLIKKIKKQSTHSLKLKEGVCLDLIKYLGLISAETIKLKLSGNKLTLIGGSSIEHQFKLPMGKVNGDKDKFENYYRAKYLASIINVIDFVNGDPQFAFSKDGAIVISQFGNDDIWAISHHDVKDMIDDEDDDDIPF